MFCPFTFCHPLWATWLQTSWDTSGSNTSEHNEANSTLLDPHAHADQVGHRVPASPWRRAAEICGRLLGIAIFFLVFCFTSRTPWALKGYRCKEWSSPLTMRSGCARGDFFLKMWDGGVEGGRGRGQGTWGCWMRGKSDGKGPRLFHDWLRLAGRGISWGGGDERREVREMGAGSGWEGDFAVLRGASEAIKRQGRKNKHRNKEGEQWGEERVGMMRETYVKAKATRAPLTTIKSRMFHKSRK